MNYGELKEAVAAYMHRKDLTDQIPLFIELTESRVNTALRALEIEGYAALSMTANPFPLPDDYNDMSAITSPVDRGPRPLERVNAARMARLQSVSANQGGGPRWFTVQAQELTVWPFVIGTDDQGEDVPVEVELEYWRRLPALVNDIDTNDVLDRWPQLYLYGSLYEAYKFTESPDKANPALGIFTSEIGEANANAASAKWGVAPAIIAG